MYLVSIHKISKKCFGVPPVPMVGGTIPSRTALKQDRPDCPPFADLGTTTLAPNVPKVIPCRRRYLATLECEKTF